MKQKIIIVTLGASILVGLGIFYSHIQMRANGSVPPPSISTGHESLSHTITLTLISAALKHHKDTTGVYPRSLNELLVSDHIGGVSLIDPRTNKPYEYTVLDNGAGFRFCYVNENSTSVCW